MHSRPCEAPKAAPVSAAEPTVAPPDSQVTTRVRKCTSMPRRTPWMCLQCFLGARLPTGVLRGPCSCPASTEGMQVPQHGQGTTLRNATKSCGPGQPPLPDLCHSIMGKRLVGAQGQCAWSLCPSPTVPQSHPRPLLEVLHVGSGPSISTACGDGLINGEQLHTSPKTFHVVEGEELTLRG